MLFKCYPGGIDMQTFEANDEGRQINPVYSEMRKNKRHRCNVLIDFTYFNKESYVKGKIVNHNQSGVCIESEFAPILGSSIFIRGTKLTPSKNEYPENYQALRTIGIAQIKWCKQLSGDDGSYRIGAQYYNSAY